jgi:hypothetical protein
VSHSFSMKSIGQGQGSLWVEYSTQDSKYYVNRETKEKVYEKPLELATPEERVEILAKREKQRAFFNTMEANIIQRLTSASAAATSSSSAEESTLTTSAGELYAESKDDHYIIGEGNGLDRKGEPMSADAADKFFDFNKPGTGLRRVGSSNLPSSGMKTRTISSLDLTSIGQSSDEGVLTEVNKLLGIGTIAQYSPDAKSEVPDFLKERKLSFDLVEASNTSKTSKSTNETRQGTSADKEGKKKRRNSTGTIYVTATLAKQDNEATIRCVCSVLHAYITEAKQKRRKSTREYLFFLDNPPDVRSPAVATREERLISDDWIVGTPPASKLLEMARASPKSPVNSPGGRNSSSDSEDGDAAKVPSIDSIILFFQCIFRTSQLEGECIIIALIYCDRLMKDTSGGFVLRHDNWRSTVFICLVMASKVWDDLSMWNSDFSMIVPGYDLERLNGLELHMLEALKYDMKVPAGQYAKYYFILRSLIAQLGIRGSSDKEVRSKGSSLDLAQLRDDAESLQQMQYNLRRANVISQHMSVPNLTSLSSHSRESLVAQANEGKKKRGDALPDRFTAHLFNSVPTHADGTVVGTGKHSQGRSSMEMSPMVRK